MITTGSSTLRMELPPQDVIFGSSPRMLQLQRTIEKVAPTSIPVLLTGESGTGKDVIARLIHQLSQSSSGPFVRVPCPSIPGPLLDPEIFGYEQANCAGAIESKPSRLEMASGGTLFLDEISDLPPTFQAKLLQGLEDGQFFRAGEIKVEVRLVCATNRPIGPDVHTGQFRPDLYFRVNGIVLELPPLRERACDIPLLVDFFLQSYARKHRIIPRPFSRESLACLTAYQWPGNIRELGHLVQRHLIVRDDAAIFRELAPKPATTVHADFSVFALTPLKTLRRKSVQELEKQIISKALEAYRGNRKLASRALMISYRGVLYRLRRRGVPPKRRS